MAGSTGEGGMVRRAGRATLRAGAMLATLQLALAHFLAMTAIRRRRLTVKERADWLQRWCRRALAILHIQVQLAGEVPRCGLLVANHLSYLDILVFGALAPSVFVAKMEVSSWPLFARMARLAGTIFLDRWRLSSLGMVVEQVESVLRGGALVVAFPEATTTDGAALLPFRPMVFEAAVRSQARVTAAHIRYTDAAGEFATSLCWFGEVRPVRHLAGMFARARTHATVRVGSPGRQFAARKEAAAWAYTEVEGLHRAHGLPGSPHSAGRNPQPPKSRSQQRRTAVRT